MTVTAHAEVVTTSTVCVTQAAIQDGRESTVIKVTNTKHYNLLYIRNNL